ncbi:MAG: hypothetical protein BIFFINMI_02941 [Phycisphaerae bacterium]|nr:hypothetical protein [Phycisphaerae bacterium]
MLNLNSSANSSPAARPEAAPSAEIRRPLKTRSRAWAQALARWLGGRGVQPNQISLAGVAFALLGGGLLLLSRLEPGWWRALAAIGAAACVQLRLMCNMLDGLVAVEGGRGRPSGAIYNELPDRFEDAVLLACAGYAVRWLSWAAALGWAAAVLAVITAYVRALGASVGAGQDFRGPLAKPQRMFLLTVACLASAAEWLAGGRGWAMPVALGLIVVGTAATAWRRAAGVVRELESK